jgi:hypothetical protein
MLLKMGKTNLYDRSTFLFPQNVRLTTIVNGEKSTT